jgi:hypothetical protein
MYDGTRRRYEGEFVTIGERQGKYQFANDDAYGRSEARGDRRSGVYVTSRETASRVVRGRPCDRTGIYRFATAIFEADGRRKLRGAVLREGGDRIEAQFVEGGRRAGSTTSPTATVTRATSAKGR